MKVADFTGGAIWELLPMLNWDISLLYLPHNIPTNKLSNVILPTQIQTELFHSSVAILSLMVRYLCIFPGKPLGRSAKYHTLC